MDCLSCKISFKNREQKLQCITCKKWQHRRCYTCELFLLFFKSELFPCLIFFTCIGKDPSDYKRVKRFYNLKGSDCCLGKNGTTEKLSSPPSKRPSTLVIPPEIISPTSSAILEEPSALSSPVLKLLGSSADPTPQLN